MSVSVIPVVVPYQIAGTDGAIPSVQVNAIAESTQAALSVAQQLVATWTTLRHPGQQVSLRPGRAKVGSGPAIVEGPYAYVLSSNNHIHHMSFPRRIEGEHGERFGQLLAGLDEKLVYGLVMDCSRLEFINTFGLTGIAAQVKRIRLNLYNVPVNILKVLEVVGLMRFLSLQPDLDAALAALVAGCTKKITTS
jgi:anti-anti-sigma regulatory factor